eukprot:TRINITY_DN2013_c0_g1_i1.p7 TRINITY_DN2013_c0_g1~~TRINITY_DN2013_c0_g1_i1.p7  ORF type:complete len:251 (-),score=41.62 TRINITY_DN2013_c0_g1_i1:8165-8917(-)
MSDLEERLENSSQQQELAGGEELERKIKSLKGMNSEDRLEYLYQYIHCDNPSKYRKKLSGMTLPFGIREKNGRINRDDPCLKYRFKPDRSVEEIHAKAEKARKLREAEKRRKQREEHEKYLKNREILKRIHEQQIFQKIEKGEATGDKKALDLLKGIGKGFEGKKLTLQLLKHLNYKDINLHDEELFKPADLLGDNEDLGFLRTKLNSEKKIEKGTGFPLVMQQLRSRGKENQRSQPKATPWFQANGTTY